MVWIWPSLYILTNCIVSLWILIWSFCICVSGYSFIISFNRNSSSNSINFSKTFFSWISFKKVSDCLVFHQLVTQDSRLLLNEREIHQGKNTIDARYGRGVNAFFFGILICELLMNLPHSSTLSDLIFLWSMSFLTRYRTYGSIPCFFLFLIVINWLVLVFRSRKNIEIE